MLTIQTPEQLLLIRKKIFSPLIDYMPLTSFYTHWKHQKARGLTMFSGGIEKHQWYKMDQSFVNFGHIIVYCQYFKVEWHSLGI